MLPVVEIIFPLTLTAGPNAAVIKRKLVTLFFVFPLKLLNPFTRFDTFEIRGLACFIISIKEGFKSSPNSIALARISFFNIFNCDSVVSYLLSASNVKALFSFQALFPKSIALLIISLAFAERNKASLNLVSVIPISSSILIALFPRSPLFERPSTNFIIAVVASSSKAFLNSFVVIPATEAKSFKFFPPFSTANCIFIITLEKAVPPA